MSAEAASSTSSAPASTTTPDSGAAGSAAGGIGQAVAMVVQADADNYVRQKQSEIAMMTASANQAAQIAQAYGFDQARQ